MKIKSKWLILAGAVVVAGLFAAFGLNHNNAPQHFTAKVEKGEIHDVVEATGMINAVITVQVGSQVSGTISKLDVDFNSRVHRSEEHTSELQSQSNLVCRLLLEKKKKILR